MRHLDGSGRRDSLDTNVDGSLASRPVLPKRSIERRAVSDQVARDRGTDPNWPRRPGGVMERSAGQHSRSRSAGSAMHSHFDSSTRSG